MAHSPAALTALETMGFGTIPSPYAHARAALTAMAARRRARREFAALLMVDAHLLHDIGVTREDVRRALRACDGH